MPLSARSLTGKGFTERKWGMTLRESVGVMMLVIESSMISIGEPIVERAKKNRRMWVILRFIAGLEDDG